MARSSNTVYLVSFAAHVAGGLGLALVKPPPPRTEEVIEISTFDMEKKKKEEEKPEPEPEEAPAPAPKAAKAAPAPAPVVQNIGFVVSGGGGGPGGIAVPVAPQPVVRQEARQVASVAGPTCAEPEVKAKALSMPKPVYSDEARTAQIQGKVRVQLTIDAEGRVTDATVLEGLGHGLDEAALAAVREAKFTPAQRCGKPVSSTFSVAIRFAL